MIRLRITLRGQNSVVEAAIPTADGAALWVSEQLAPAGSDESVALAQVIRSRMVARTGSMVLSGGDVVAWSSERTT